MAIRLAQGVDAAAISQLLASLSHYYCDVGQNELPAWFCETITKQAVRDRILSDDYLNYVYMDNNKPVGYISIKDKNHLYHLFVKTEDQGKGIARLLWQYAKDASSSNYFTVRSSLYAVPVYERFGFRPDGPVGSKDGIRFQPM